MSKLNPASHQPTPESAMSVLSSPVAFSAFCLQAVAQAVAQALGNARSAGVFNDGAPPGVPVS